MANDIESARQAFFETDNPSQRRGVLIRTLWMLARKAEGGGDGRAAKLALGQLWKMGAIDDPRFTKASDLMSLRKSERQELIDAHGAGEGEDL